MALTPEAAKAMLDSLFAMPDKVKAPAKPKVAKSKAEVKVPAQPSPRTTLGLTSAGYLPALKIQRIINQHCNCCGSDREFMQPALVRFEHKKGTAIEIPAAVEMHLPVTVTESWENTPQCPDCIRLSRNLEDIIGLRQGAFQLELFA